MGVAYAESEDGIAWTKPRLDRVVADGERTNILLRKKSKTEPPPEFPYFYELFGVHRDDRDPDPSRRFKMGFLDIDWKYEGPGATRGTRGSAAVWAWRGAPMASTGSSSTTGRPKKALPEVVEAWSRYDWFKTWFSGRAVARVESPDFLRWDFAKPDTAPVVMTADLRDKPGTEIYSMKVFRYEGIYIGLVQVFHATPDESTLDVQIAVGEDLRFYYGGRMYRHGPYSGPDKGPERGGIGFAATIRAARCGRTGDPAHPAPERAPLRHLERMIAVTDWPQLPSFATHRSHPADRIRSGSCRRTAHRS